MGRGPTHLVALDCEMVQTETSHKALVRVSAVDHRGATLIHTFVKPEGKVVDFRTEVTPTPAAATPPKQHALPLWGALPSALAGGREL